MPGKPKRHLTISECREDIQERINRGEELIKIMSGNVFMLPLNASTHWKSWESDRDIWHTRNEMLLQQLELPRLGGQ